MQLKEMQTRLCLRSSQSVSRALRRPLIGQSSVSRDRSDASRRASVVPCAGASAVLLRLYTTTMEETDQPERVSTQGHDTQAHINLNLEDIPSGSPHTKFGTFCNDFNRHQGPLSPLVGGLFEFRHSKTAR